MSRFFASAGGSDSESESSSEEEQVIRQPATAFTVSFISCSRVHNNSRRPTDRPIAFRKQKT